MNKFWQIRNAKAATPEILIYGPIVSDPYFDEEVGAKAFRDDLKALGEPAAIDVRINSPGGDVFEAYAIHGALANHPSTINVHIDGVAASAASVVAMAGDTINMPENALMMIHQASGVAIGTATDMRKLAEALDKVDDGIIAIYANRTGMDRDALREMLVAETWMNGAEAVEFGFADTLAEPVRLAACAKFQWEELPYAHIPNQLRAKPGETPRLDDYRDRFARIAKARQRLRFAAEIHSIRKQRYPESPIAG